jgi:hypothetical protein
MLTKNLNRLSWFLLLFFLFLIKSDYTDADIFAERAVRDNTLSAITLDFSNRVTFNENLIDNLFYSIGFIPGGFDLAALKINNDSEQNFTYNLKTIIISGDDNFCQELQLEVFNSQFKSFYKGSLTGLNVNSQLKGYQAESWIFYITLNSSSEDLKNSRCEFNFDFKTYRQDANESGGIFAQRKVNNIISSSDW